MLLFLRLCLFLFMLMVAYFGGRYEASQDVAWFFASGLYEECGAEAFAEFLGEPDAWWHPSVD